MSTIKVNLDPVFTKLITKLKNRRPLMRAISGIMLDEVHQNFNQQGNPLWRALAPQTIKDRRSKGYWPGKILQRTGQLLKSVHARYDNDSAKVGTNKAYAGVHQFGATIYQGARSDIFMRNRYKRNSMRIHPEYGVVLSETTKGRFKKGKSKVRGQGTTFKARTIVVPPRPFLTISDATLRKIEQTIVDYLRQ